MHKSKMTSNDNIKSVIAFLADVSTFVMNLRAFLVPDFRNTAVLVICTIIYVIIFIWAVCKLNEIICVKKRNEEILVKKIQQRMVGENPMLLYKKHGKIIRLGEKIIGVIMAVCIFSVSFNCYQLYMKVKAEVEVTSDDNRFGQEITVQIVQQIGKDVVDTISRAKIVNDMEQAETNNLYDSVSTISFCLNESVIPELEQEQAESVFYVLYENGEEVVRKHVNELDSIKIASGTLSWTEGEKANIEAASIAEKEFNKKVEKAKSYKERRLMEEWQKNVPSVSNYKNDVAEVRVRIIEAGKGNSEICVLTAHDFKYIADEYEKQDKSYQAVIYYWGVCIIYMEKALSYDDMPETAWKGHYHYLRSRYKDIADYLEKNWDKIEEEDKAQYAQWKDAAKQIYAEMP